MLHFLYFIFEKNFSTVCWIHFHSINRIDSWLVDYCWLKNKNFCIFNCRWPLYSSNAVILILDRSFLESHRAASHFLQRWATSNIDHVYFSLLLKQTLDWFASPCRLHRLMTWCLHFYHLTARCCWWHLTRSDTLLLI